MMMYCGISVGSGHFEMVVENKNVQLKNWKLNYYSARISELELLEMVVREGADFSNILEVIQLFTIEVTV